jgi:predicted RNase H-like HicB family nuclease
MRKHYVAVVHKEPDSHFRALFPDFPDVVTIAPTLDAAIKRAVEVLAPHVKAMLADGVSTPADIFDSRGASAPTVQPRRLKKARSSDVSAAGCGLICGHGRLP